eukprot:gene47492-20825_t
MARSDLSSTQPLGAAGPNADLRELWGDIRHRKAQIAALQLQLSGGSGASSGPAPSTLSASFRCQWAPLPQLVDDLLSILSLLNENTGM